MADKNGLLRLLYLMFFWLIVTTLLFMAECSSMNPFAYLPATESWDGRGLFSGDDGVFTFTKDNVSFSKTKE